jgi:hypothetical protein
MCTGEPVYMSDSVQELTTADELRRNFQLLVHMIEIEVIDDYA